MASDRIRQRSTVAASGHNVDLPQTECDMADPSGVVVTLSNVDSEADSVRVRRRPKGPIDRPVLVKKLFTNPLTPVVEEVNEEDKGLPN